MANGDIVDIDPTLEKPERVVKKFVIARAEVSVLVPRLDQNDKEIGHQEVAFDMQDIPDGAFKTQVKQLIRRMLESDGWVKPQP